MIHTIQIRRHARSEQSPGRHGQRAAQVGHTRQRAAVEDVEAVLNIPRFVRSSPGKTDGQRHRTGKGGRTVCSLRISSSKLTTPGRAAVTRSYTAREQSAPKVRMLVGRTFIATDCPADGGCAYIINQPTCALSIRAPKWLKGEDIPRLQARVRAEGLPY